MAEFIVHILYKNHRGSRREMDIPCATLEQAQDTLEKMSEAIKADPFDTFLYGLIKGERLQEQIQEQPTEPTHYKITAKSLSGGYYSALIPITADLDEALDRVDADLKIIGIEKVTRRVVAGVTGLTTSRLHARSLNQ